VIQSLIKETVAKDAKIKALEDDLSRQALHLKETSLSNEKEKKEYDTRIRNLKTHIRQLDASTHQTLDEQQQVAHAHFYIQTLLHKQRTHCSHGVR
jgi:hypothetical protein